MVAIWLVSIRPLTGRVVLGTGFLAATAVTMSPSYPPDVLYSLGIDTTRVAPDRMRCELTMVATSYRVAAYVTP